MSHRIVANSTGNSYKTAEFSKRYEEQRTVKLPKIKKKSTKSKPEKSASEKLNDLMFAKVKFHKLRIVHSLLFFTKMTSVQVKFNETSSYEIGKNVSRIVLIETYF